MSHGATAGISQGAALIQGVYETSAAPCPWEAFDLVLLVFSRTSVFLVLVLIGAETQYAELLATCNYTGILLNIVCQTLLKQLTQDFFSVHHSPVRWILLLLPP